MLDASLARFSRLGMCADLGLGALPLYNSVTNTATPK